MKRLIDKLHQEQMLTAEEFHRLLANRSEETDQYARELANQVRQEVYGNKIYVRGLIEFTNYCKNDCYYCGIRRSNQNAQRYRLTEEDILECCRQGYELGFRTFVLQGGEDGFFTDDRIVQIVRKIKEQYPDCAQTLSIGEKSEESYRAYREAGADRYLLRHETADPRHYMRLHPLAFFPTAGKAPVNAAAQAAAKRLSVDYRVRSTARDGLYSWAVQQGIPALLIERGGQGLWSQPEVNACKADVLALMQHLGILPGGTENRKQQEIVEASYVEAEAEGFWYPLVTVNQSVRKGDSLGRLESLTGEVRAEFDGIVLYHTTALGVRAGEVLITYGHL